MEVTYDNYLAHYGVKGMKWGVRRQRSKSISKQAKADYQKAIEKQHTRAQSELSRISKNTSPEKRAAAEAKIKETQKAGKAQAKAILQKEKGRAALEFYGNTKNAKRGQVGKVVAGTLIAGPFGLVGTGIHARSKMKQIRSYQSQ